jgi:hypothetical protein
MLARTRQTFEGDGPFQATELIATWHLCSRAAPAAASATTTICRTDGNRAV